MFGNNPFDLRGRATQQTVLNEAEGKPVPRDKDGSLVAKPGFKRVLTPKGYVYKKDTGKPVTVGGKECLVVITAQV